MAAPRIHYLQHVPYEGPGSILSWADQHGYEIHGTKIYQKESFPQSEDYDWLVIMGGPMGVYDEVEHPWLLSEEKCIYEAIQAGKTVIGICLGAQLIATVLGAHVYNSPQKEIGWFPVHKTTNGKIHPLLDSIPNTFTAFHWHGDTFELPAGSVDLFYTNICPNQAFLYDDRVLAIQFHFEVTPASIHQMIENGKDELVPGECIQEAGTILEQSNYCQSLDQYLNLLFDQMAGR